MNIDEFVGEHFSVANDKFIRGETYIAPAKAVYDQREVISLVSAALGMKWVDGSITKQFERELARYLGTRMCVTTNSGSSANLLAISSLTSPKLGSRALKAGDEVITTAVGFPTTINPIIQNGLVPVFVDINIPSYNTSPFIVSDAITSKTRAIFLAHTLGNPYDVGGMRDLADTNNLFLIEDCADVLGGEWEGRKVGTFGDIATVSFYPAHHLAVGEGGACFTNNPMLDKIIRSFRDWGRDCWCAPAHDDTCGKRFCWQMGELPEGFDHKYVYTHIGYNLKSTDFQSSIGIEQLKKLPSFVEARRKNWRYLREGLEDLENYFCLPEHYLQANPSWFGFVLTVRPDAKFTRNDFARHLEKHMIGTRNIFGGNMTRQPAYIGKTWRKSGDLPKSDIVMNNSLWIACHPALTTEMMDYMIEVIHEFVK